MAKRKKSKSSTISSTMSFESSEELRKVKRALKQATKFKREAEDRGESRAVISGITQAAKKFKKKKEGIERKERVKKRLKSLAEKAVAGELKAFKKPFLTTPTAKGPTPISARRTLKSFAQSTGPVVREVEKEEIVQDNRSQFFNRELAKEERGINKWLN